MPDSFLRPGVHPDPLPADGPAIPRRLWQTTRDRAAMLPHLADCVARLKAANPGWTHELLDDASMTAFLGRVASERFLRAWARLEPRHGAAKADLWRYMTVYLHGGAYLDLKSGTSRPLDAILRPDDRFLISQWDNGPDGMFPGVGLRKTLDVPGGEYEQWFVIAAPGHPFLAAVLEGALHNIETYSPFRHGVSSRGVIEVMGPNHYTRAIRAIEHLHPHRRICAWTEGLHYTLLGDLHAHQDLDPGHHGRSMRPPVTAAGLRGLDWLRYRLLTWAYFPYGALRWLNHRRLARRWQRKTPKPPPIQSRA